MLIKSAFQYKDQIQRLIKRLKYQQDLSSLAMFVDNLVDQIDKHELPDVLIPVPSHKLRTFSRGIDVSYLISHELTKKLDIPLLPAFVREKQTKPLEGLSRLKRKQELTGCFSQNEVIKASYAVLIDDVRTTGATTDELRRLLQKQGVDKVGVWTLAQA